MLLWVGEERTEAAVKPFFTEVLGRRRCATLAVVCMDMWAAYAKLVTQQARNARILFDRFHIVKHRNEALDEVRRSKMRRLAGKQKAAFKSTRWLLLKNPWNLTADQRERLSTLVRWNLPIVRAWYLKEAFQLFGEYRQPARSQAQAHLQKWMRSAMCSWLEPVKKFVRMLRSHLAARGKSQTYGKSGVRTSLKPSKHAVVQWDTKEEMRDFGVSPRADSGHSCLDQDPAVERSAGRHEQPDQVHQPAPDGFRSAQNFIAAIYHGCARLPLPKENRLHFWDTSQIEFGFAPVNFRLRQP